MWRIFLYLSRDTLQQHPDLQDPDTLLIFNASIQFYTVVSTLQNLDNLHATADRYTSEANVNREQTIEIQSVY